MAGINANFNRGFNVGGLNQTGNTRNTQQAKNDVQQELKLNLNQVDGFARSNNDVQEAKKKDDEPKQGGDGAKKGWKEKLGEFFQKLGESLVREGNPYDADSRIASVSQAAGSTLSGHDFW